MLSTFTSTRPLIGVSELAREVGLSRSSAHRYIATLAALGYLEQDRATRRYRLGPRVLDLGFSAINSMELRAARASHLQALSDATGHTVNMAVLDGVDIVYVERCRSASIGQREIDLNLHVGSRLPAYCTSMGKVLLAGLQPDELEQRLAQMELSRRGPNTIVGVKALRRGARARPRARARGQQRGARLRAALDRGARPRTRRAPSSRRSTSPCTARSCRWRTSWPASAPSSARRRARSRCAAATGRPARTADSRRSA